MTNEELQQLSKFASALIELRRAAGLGVGLSLNAEQTKALLWGIRTMRTEDKARLL